MNITNVNQKVMISNPKEMEVENKNMNTITDAKSAVISGNTDISISEETRSTGICQTVVETNVTSLSGVLAQEDKPTDYKETLDYVVNTMTEDDYEAILQEGIVLEECEVGQLECVLQRKKENAGIRQENPDGQTAKKEFGKENQEKIEEVVIRDTSKDSTVKKANVDKSKDAVAKRVDTDKSKDAAVKKVDTDKSKDAAVKKVDTDKYKDSVAKEIDTDKYKDPMAKEVVQKLVDANLPVTDANVSAMLNALKLSDVMTQLSDDGMANLISKEIPITLENIYNSQYSATKVQAPEQAIWQEVSVQAENILREAGFEITEEVMEKAKWLFDHRLPISENTMDTYNSLLEFREGIDPEILLTKMTEAMQQGKPPKQADLNVVLSNKIEQAVRDFAKISEKAVVKVVENGEKLDLVHLKQAQQEITEQNVHKDFAQNVEKNANQSIKQVVIQKTEQNVNQKANESVSQKAEQNVNQKVNESVSQKAEQNVNQKVNESISQKAEQNLNQKVEESVSQNAAQNVSQKILTVEGESVAEITAYRQLEEIRLKMTLEAAHSLAGKGIRIDTSELQDIVEGLKELEKQYYGSLLEEGNVEKTDANISLLKATTETVESVKTMPAAVLGATLKVNVAQSIETLHETGKELKASYDKAGVAYEPLMTAPRADMGDSIQKAFRNVDSILESMDMEVTEDNKRAVRILGYNRMEINEDSVMAVKAYDSQVTSLVKELHPAATVELIRRGVNPLDMPMEELIDEVKQLKEELGVTSEEKYSTYLWKLQKQEDISDTERKSYVGIYRLLNNVEKTDGAAIGAVLDTGKELTMGNLLTAVRTLKHKGVNVKVNDNFGALESLTFTKETITEQIQTGFDRKAPEIKENVSAQMQAEFDGKASEVELKGNSSDTSASEEVLRQNTLSYQKNTVKEIAKQISPDKLAQVVKSMDDKQAGLDKVLDMPLEQLKESLQQTEEKTPVQRDMSAEERKSYETVSRLASYVEKMDEAEVEAAVEAVTKEAEKPLTLGNLLTAIRALGNKDTNERINDRLGAVELEKNLFNTNNSKEVRRQAMVENHQNTVKEIVKQISPDKLAQVVKSMDSEKADLNRVLNMPLEQLKEALQQTEGKPIIQREISVEERKNYEVISRLVNNMEKMDGAEVGTAIRTVLDTGKVLTMGNLLTAVRSPKSKKMEAEANERLSKAESTAFSKESGIEQIQMGFGKHTSDKREDSSDANSSDETLKQNTLTYQQNTVKEIMEQISPDKLAQILDDDGEWAGLDKFMNMTLEQLKEALQKTEGNPELQKDYVKERLEEIRTVVGKSKEAIEYLEQYNQPVSIERLTAVLEYFVGDKNLFKEFKKYADKVNDNKFDQKIAKVKEGETEELTEVMDSLWESIEEPEQLQDKFAEMERKAEEVLQREYAVPDISSEDIRNLRLLGKAIALTGSMSRQEHYEIPMKTGDSITNVSLTIRKGSGEKGKLQISMISEKYGRVEVEATIKKQAINGVILCESKEGLNKLNGCKKQLQDELKEIGVTVKQLSTAISEKALERLRSSEETNSQTDTSLLYKTAKVIIRQLRAVETE